MESVLCRVLGLSLQACFAGQLCSYGLELALGSGWVFLLCKVDELVTFAEAELTSASLIQDFHLVMQPQLFTISEALAPKL